MNRRQRRNQQKKEIRKSQKAIKDLLYGKKQTQYTADCLACAHFEECMERRGKCRSYYNYADVKRKVAEEIENLRKGEGTF